MKIVHTLILSVAVVILSACQTPQQNPAPADTETSVGLLQHNVYFYLNEDVTEEEKAQF